MPAKNEALMVLEVSALAWRLLVPSNGERNAGWYCKTSVAWTWIAHHVLESVSLSEAASGFDGGVAAAGAVAVGVSAMPGPAAARANTTAARAGAARTAATSAFSAMPCPPAAAAIF